MFKRSPQHVDPRIAENKLSSSGSLSVLCTELYSGFRDFKLWKLFPQ
jgi:hypothetical protein